MSEGMNKKMEIKEEAGTATNQQMYKSNYKTAIAVSGVVEIVGWVVVAVGIISALVGMGSTSKYGGGASVVVK
jgi:hypothetical protein